MTVTTMRQATKEMQTKRFWLVCCSLRASDWDCCDGKMGPTIAERNYCYWMNWNWYCYCWDFGGVTADGRWYDGDGFVGNIVRWPRQTIWTVWNALNWRRLDTENWQKDRENICFPQISNANIRNGFLYLSFSLFFFRFWLILWCERTR